jgi:hypothetical protein
MSKLIIVMILIAMMFSFTACEEALPTGNELLDNVFQAMEKVESYKEEMDITMEMYLEAEEFSSETPLSIDVTTEVSARYDLTNEEMVMNIDFDMSSEDEDLAMKMGMKMYLLDSTMYSLLDFPMFPSQWTKTSVPQDYWGDVSYLESQMHLLQAADIQVLKEERRENIRCYVIQITPDLAELFQLMLSQLQASLGEMPSSELEQISEMFDDFSVKMWIEKDTYHILFADVTMKIELTPEMMGEYNEEGMLSINVTMSMKAYDYNEPVEIVLPVEAEEAEEGMMMW